MYWLFESEQPYDDDCADGWLPDCRTVQVLGSPRHRVLRKIRQPMGSQSSGQQRLQERGVFLITAAVPCSTASSEGCSQPPGRINAVIFVGNQAGHNLW